MPDPTPCGQDIQALRNEIIRLSKVNQALMNRVEQSANSQGSAFNVFQNTVMLEGQVRQRTEELQAALAENQKINRALHQAKLQMELEMQERQRAQLELEQANKRLESLSITDTLTGLPNRRRFMDVLAAEWQRALRAQTSLSVVMIDIDQFKLYNDHYGHLGGDSCLRRVAATLSQGVRTCADLAARYGGEEFAMILPASDQRAAHVVCQRICASVAALKEPHVKSTVGIVTVSIGLAACIPSHLSTSEQLLQLADTALYEAKRKGRNQVME